MRTKFYFSIVNEKLYNEYELGDSLTITTYITRILDYAILHYKECEIYIGENIVDCKFQSQPEEIMDIFLRKE